MNNLPSDVQSYLTEIAERLWTGHASVMVGAGFSKNADNTINSTKQPPNWWELGDAFYEKIHNEKPTNQTKYANLLKLAEEYEAAFGRSALEHFVAKNIADNEYEPSELHKMLMELPWTDVFTTNYDTLLERSCKDVLSRRYDVVVNQNDLIYSNKPRIIKLHGSLPSERPFIITEEDYRIYPKKFAPFVNTVQQSLLENTLCLIGFSGDDPNFLQWIGWINDNIGKTNASKIYLVGVLNLSESQKKLLYNKNIIPVDLSKCNDIKGDHKKGLKFFIDYLAKQQIKRENLDWPLSSDLKTVHREKEEANIRPLIEEWAKCRKKYPNWIILPQAQRDKLWLFTEHHSSNEVVFEYLKKAFDDLDYIYELNWRLEKCLFPIWNNMVPYFQKILDRYNFFPNEISDRKEINSDTWSNQKIDWRKYRNYWIHLSLSLLRFYREENFEKEWTDTYNIINLIQLYLSAEQLAQFYYEQVLYAIFKMQHIEAKKILDKWPQNNLSVFWNAKRAMLMTEFGQLTEAANLLESSLLEIRRKLNLSPIENDYTWVSHEAYIMYQLKMVQDNIRWGKRIDVEKPKDKTENFNERWNDLLQYKCDPWSEQKYFDLILQQSYFPKNKASVKNEFEIGRNTRSFTIGGASRDFIVAYTFLRYLEELAVPLSLSSVNFNEKTVNGALKRIISVSPKWGMAILNRYRDSKSVEAVFDRLHLANISINTTNGYIREYLNQFDMNILDKELNPLSEAFINKLPIILSRLCAKCSDELKVEMFKLYHRLCKDKPRLKGLDKMLKNLINSSNNDTLTEIIPILLDTPVFDSDLNINYNLVEPFEVLKIFDFSAKIKLDRSTINIIFDNAAEDKKIRINALKRLMFLYLTKQLDKKQTDKVFKIMWQHIDTNGFPKYTSYYHFAFIKWPQPNNVNTEEMYRKYILENNFNVQGLRTKEGISMSNGDDRYAQELLYGSQTINKTDGIIWSLEELDNILVKCEKWWKSDKQYVIEEKYKHERFAGSIHEEFIERFKNLTNILARVLGYRRDDLSSQLKKRITELTAEIANTAVPVSKIKVVFGLYKDYESYFTELKRALTSKDREVLIDALDSIILAVHNSPYQKDAAFIVRLLDTLVIPLQWRITALIGDIFSVIKDFIKHSDLDLTSIEEHLYNSLQDILDMDIDSENISFNDYLLLKRNSISLAGVIYKKCSEEKTSIHQTILNWKAVSEKDEEFGDIRNRW